MATSASAPPLHPALEAFKASGASKVKVAVGDIDGVLRGKLLHKDKFFAVADPHPGGGSGFCDVVLGWDMTDSGHDNTSVTGWQHGFPDALARLDRPPSARCRGTTASRFSWANSSTPTVRRTRSARARRSGGCSGALKKWAFR